MNLWLAATLSLLCAIADVASSRPWLSLLWGFC